MKIRSPRNRTLTLHQREIENYAKHIRIIDKSIPIVDLENTIFENNFLEIADYIPSDSVDLIVADPPYNLAKKFGDLDFKKKKTDEYIEYVDSWMKQLYRILKEDGSIYVCSDWSTSTAIDLSLQKYFKVRNRITWEREKGRGALSNWKNASEDIWFATKSDTYYFNPDSVKLKRKVIAPYRVDGKPKDWEETSEGNYRLTFPSNFWNDITIPYWSMPENTDHPTQKPEKLIAKLVLASSKPGDFVFDPFLGSGTTAVVAKKLGRKYSGTEINREYLLWAAKRLEIAESNFSIQGYQDGVFWERNSFSEMNRTKTNKNAASEELFS